MSIRRNIDLYILLHLMGSGPEGFNQKARRILTSTVLHLFPAVIKVTLSHDFQSSLFSFRISLHIHKTIIQLLLDYSTVQNVA